MMKSITTKLLISIGIITICFLALVLYSSYSLTNKQINKVIEQQASMALQFDLAIRGYVGNHIRPVMYDLIDEDAFIVEAMSTSYVARSIFEEVRNEFPEYIIKFSSDNPRNPINQAGPEELKIIEYFDNNPHLNKWEGIIIIKDKKYMAKFNARRMKESCLHCHGDPKDAPASMIEKYGSVAGFNRKIGKVIGMDTVAIPIHKITEKIWHELKTTFLIFAIGLLLFFCAVVIVIKFLVINRLVLISKHFASAVEETDYSQIAQIDVNGKDEIYDLAFGYNTLTDKLKDFYSSLNSQVKQRTKSLEIVNQKLLQEINEKSEAEKALRESEERFKALHNASFGGIAIHDKGIILECNKGLSEMTGYSVTDLIGMDGLLLIAQKSRGAVMNNIVSGYEKAYEATGLRKNGEEFPIRLEARNVPYKGKNVRAVEFRDLTEHKLSEMKQEQLQVQLTQAQKMESVGRIAGGIAHDFNNILTGILGFSQLAKNHLNNPEKAVKDIEQIIVGGQKAAELVSQILTFSRKSAHEKQPLAIYVVVKDVLKLLRASIPTSIEIKEMIVSETTVMADPTKVHQVLMNLCTNAYHAMLETGGVLIVGLKDVEFSVKDCIPGQNIMPGKYLRLEISDTGHGMDVITKEKIFEPYFTTKTPDKGTGLGLAVVFGIIKEHNGYINVYSEPGHGATFHVYFPIIEKASESYIAEEKEEASAPSLGMETILIVDDEEAILKSTQALLQELGYIINPVESGIKAFELYKRKPDHFDLVITDMTMPKMSGFELSQKILELRPEQPIILCTGHSELINKEKAIAIGIRQYFEKPIIIRELSKVIRMVLDDAK